MNNKKFLITTGAFILAIASVVAGRASVRFGTSSAYFKTAGNGCRLLTSINSAFFTTTPQNHPASIKTITGGQTPLYKGTSCQPSALVYFHL